jgi:hypothetical protein
LRELAKRSTASWTPPQKEIWIGEATEPNYIASLVKALQANQARLLSLEKVVKQLSEDRAVIELPEKGAFETWIESQEAEEYAGNHVAWLPDAGVIAFGPKLSTVIFETSKHARKEEIILGFVSGARI